MDTEKDHHREFAALQVVVGDAGFAESADSKREYPELSAAEFRRFLSAANEAGSDPTARACRRARNTRALLALLLIVFAGLAVFLAGGGKEEGTDQASEFARLQREVCGSALPLTHRTPNPLENLCQPHP